LLDEPTNGLDPEGRAEMLELVRHLSHGLGKSVVLSTHILQDVEAVCDAAVVIEKGAVVAQGTLQELTGREPTRHTMTIEPPESTLPTELEGGVRVERGEGGVHTVWMSDRASAEQVFRAVRSAGARVRSFEPHRSSLEEVFLRAIRPEGTQAEARG
jgi:ABC-2 type transport system ATP-binding protein